MTESRPLRVLIVDDSAFARRVLRQALERNANIEVVGIAGDGLEALEKITLLEPDVVTLDLVMPELDGIGVLTELQGMPSPPRVVVVCFSDQESELVVRALQLGAVDFLKKPTALATDRLYELSAELVGKVTAAGRAQSPRLLVGPPESRRSVLRFATRRRLLVIGTSTGGPQALTRLLAQLPAEFPVPIAIALHIPGEYTEALAQRLDAGCLLQVVEARDELELRPGLVVLAKGGWNLEIERRGEGSVVRVTRPIDESLHVPSVDVLFRTAAQSWGSAALGAVLTGMGDDGLEGARALVARGGQVLTEAPASCVIYGMPRRVMEEGLSAEQAPLDDMVAAIVRRLQ
ncbi:MAG: protein-glutamate methylesterase [Pseudomonadota bacterium]